MNWELVGWFAGVIATLVGIKFVWTLFRTLFSKESMVRVIDSVGNSAQKAADKMSRGFSEKMAEKRARKEKEKEYYKPEVVNR